LCSERNNGCISERAKERQEQQYNKKAVDKRFQVDDFVLIKVEGKGMFDPKYEGPYPVVAEAGFDSFSHQDEQCG
jgi:ribosomal protein L21E